MAKKLSIFIILFAGLFLFLNNASAQNPFNINFPVAELGNCGSYEECKVYCDNPENLNACIKYAEEHQLLSQEEIQKAEQFIEETGPGGCQGTACQTYCEDSSHRAECLEFAHNKGFISDEEYNIAKKVVSEGGPGGCRSAEECWNYCQNPGNLDSCVDFSREHEFISEEDANHIKKTFGSGPGGCKGEDQCRQFCENPENQLTCVDWAEQNGFMSREEAQRVRKFIGKTGPGGCQGEQCEAYCEDPSHQEECFNFAKENGLIAPEEIERAEKFLKISKTGGPGGCIGRACQTYCQDPSHQEECFNFAKSQGLMSPEDEKNFEVGQKLNEKLRESGGPGECKTEEECRNYCSDPNRAEECIAFASAHGGIPEEQARAMLKQFTEQRFDIQGEFQHSSEFERRFREEHERRFEQFRQLESTFRGGGSGFGGIGGPGGGQFVGPGGCTDPSTCIKYCNEHPSECFSFGPPGQPDYRPPEGGIPPGHDFFPRIQTDIIHEFNQSEVPFDYEYCKTHPEECSKYFPSSTQQKIDYPCPAMPTVDQCPPGQVKVVAYSSLECGIYYICQAADSGTTNCPDGQYWDGKSCVAQTTDPATECVKYGGTWDGTNCVGASSGQTHACPEGQYWDGTSCVGSTSSGSTATGTYDPATECVKYGGTWDGNTCQIPTPPTTYNPSFGGFLASFLQTFLNFLLIR